MPKVQNITNNVVVEDGVLKMLLQKISELQSEIAKVSASEQSLQVRVRALELGFHS